MGIRKKIKEKISQFFLNRGLLTLPKVIDSEIIEFLKILKPVAINLDHIRIGGNSDGGYLVPNDLKDVKYCFSPGVGNISKFEEELVNRKIKSFLADYSVNDYHNKSNYIDFEKKFIGAVTQENYISIKDWISNKVQYNKSDNLILQMDIEGDEYEVLSALDIETLNKFRIMIIEFHNLHYIFDKSFFKKFQQIIKTINKIFYCTHVHPNNDVDLVVRSKNIIIPSVMEFTFIKKNRVQPIDKKLSFPNILDKSNNPNKKDIKLPDCWYNDYL